MTMLNTPLEKLIFDITYQIYDAQAELAVYQNEVLVTTTKYKIKQINEYLDELAHRINLLSQKKDILISEKQSIRETIRKEINEQNLTNN